MGIPTPFCLKKHQNRIVLLIFCLLEQSLIFLKKLVSYISFNEWDKSWPNIYYNDTQQFNLEKHGIFPPPFCLNENSILLFWHILLQNITAKRGPTTRQGRIMYHLLLLSKANSQDGTLVCHMVTNSMPRYIKSYD